jgi:hypothetical protein
MKGVVLHPDLAVGPNIHQPEQPLQQRRPCPAFVGDEWELVVLDAIAVGMDAID